MVPVSTVVFVSTSVFVLIFVLKFAIKRVIQRLIPAKLYKSLSSRLIGFSKVTSLAILTHLITKYAELDDDTIQDIDKNM